MRRTARALFAVVALAGVALAEGSGPRLTVASRDYDFGEVVQGTKVEVTVPLKNTGDAPLHVTQVETSCGCTVADAPRAPIPPGGEAPLVLRFDSTHKLGLQSYDVQIYSDDPTQEDRGRYCTVLRLQGEVRSLYRITPAGAFFGELVRDAAESATPGALAEREVVILGRDEAAGGFQAKLGGSVPDWVQAEVAPVEERGQKGVKLKVRLLRHAPLGELECALTLETGVELQPRLEIPVVAILCGRFAGPPYVPLGKVARALGAERRIPLERRDGGDGMPILGVELQGGPLQVRREPISARREDLVLTVPVDAPPGPFTAVVRVLLDDPAQPLLEFPVFGEVQPRLRAEPPLLLLPAQGPAEATLTLRGGEVKEATLEGGAAGITVRLERGQEPARIVVTLAPGAQPRGAVLIRTGVAGEETLRVPLRGR